MSSSLPPPWAGLRPFAARVDLWSLVDALGGPAAAECASAAEWAAVGLPPACRDELGARAVPGRWLWPGHPDWPARLVGLPKGPVALHWEGSLTPLGAPGVAVVGARSCTRWGRKWSRDIAQAVAEAGGVVVSGLARGIDAEAHLAARGKTIAVLGQGLAAPMAGWQKVVRDQVRDRGGLVLSELAPDEHASTFTFPIRNRIIAGLVGTVVVVEAAKRSGARITARCALDAGRDVLAVPGPPDAPASVGCLELIAQGATMVQSVDTVLQEAGLRRRR